MLSSRSVLLLLLIAILALTGCIPGCGGSDRSARESSLPANDPMVLIVKHRADTAGVMASAQLLQAFEYAKIPAQMHDLQISAGELAIPPSVRLVVLATTELESLADSTVEEIVGIAGSGGGVLFTQPVYDSRFAFLQGIKPDSDYQSRRDAQGFQFTRAPFPGFDNGSFRTPVTYYHRGLDRSAFTDSVTVLAASRDSLEIPVILRSRIGRGSSILLNSQVAPEKTYRGLIFSLALSMLEGVAYPVANVSTIFLDDFPAPLYAEHMPPIDWEYGISHGAFVAEHWWPDMQALADHYEIDYSATVAFNYNANVVPPFDFNEWTQSDQSVPGRSEKGSIGLARDIAESRHELAFHGYNHFSLLLEEWPNEEFMVSSLQAARKRWRIDALGRLPVTYIPPTNMIDSTGISALTKGMPQMEYISSLYYGDLREGSNREFGAEPFAPSLFGYPRTTSGYLSDDNSYFLQYNAMLMTGIWNHFIHPDDVFQVDTSEDLYASRNVQGLGWRRSRDGESGLLEAFETRIRHTLRHFPLLRFRTAREAAPMVRRWRNARIYRSFGESGQVIRYRPGEGSGQEESTYWYLYVREESAELFEERLSSQANSVARAPMWDGYLLQFDTSRDSLNLPDTGALTGADAERAAAIRAYRNYGREQAEAEAAAWTDTRLEEALAQFRRQPRSASAREAVIRLAEEFGDLQLAIDLLEQKLLLNGRWDEEDTERLVRFYGWSGQFERAWSFLESLWNRHQSNRVITLKQEMVEAYGSPGPEFDRRWLLRESELMPGDPQLLTRLARAFDNAEQWERGKHYLERLIAVNPASDTLYRHTLQRYLWYSSPDSTLQWVEGIPEEARSQLTPFAEQLAGLYAYEAGNFEEALSWAERSEEVGPMTRLQWRQQAEPEQFREVALRTLEQSPGDDSLRAYVGRELIYSGDLAAGLEVLYPLFQNGSPPADVRQLVRTEIGYQGTDRQEELYRRYPLYFSEAMAADMKHRQRVNEGVSGGLRGSYASDNFSNRTAGMELFAEWGNRNETFHTVTAGRTLVRSDIAGTTAEDGLSSLFYSYQRKLSQQTMQATLNAGFWYAPGQVLPEIGAGLWKAQADSTFTSGQLSFGPMITNRAIEQEIYRARGTLYREDYWLDRGKLMTTFTGQASWYTDRVFSYEAVGRAYAKAFSTSVIRLRAIGELAYLDATTDYSGGIPYWTPSSLFIKGAGGGLQLGGNREDGGLVAELELLGKHSEDGFYLATVARLNADLTPYWQLSLSGQYSSSQIYRYNNIGFTLRHLFPTRW